MIAIADTIGKLVNDNGGRRLYKQLPDFDPNALRAMAQQIKSPVTKQYFLDAAVFLVRLDLSFMFATAAHNIMISQTASKLKAEFSNVMTLNTLDVIQHGKQGLSAVDALVKLIKDFNSLIEG